MEEWRPIPGLDGYEASSEGRIRSLDRVRTFPGRWGPTQRRHAGRVLAERLKANGWGGFYASFYTDGGVYWQVNRAVCTAFHGPAPSDRHEAAHGDGDTLNNAPGNLRWATPTENAADKEVHGTSSQGERNGAARLSGEAIEPIFDRYIAGERSADIGASHGVTGSSIVGILRRFRWRHVPIPESKVAAAAARAALNIERARTEENARRSRLARGLSESARTGAVRAQ